MNFHQKSANRNCRFHSKVSQKKIAHFWAFTERHLRYHVEVSMSRSALFEKGVVFKNSLLKKGWPGHWESQRQSQILFLKREKSVKSNLWHFWVKPAISIPAWNMKIHQVGRSKMPICGVEERFKMTHILWIFYQCQDAKIPSGSLPVPPPPHASSPPLAPPGWGSRKADRGSHPPPVRFCQCWEE